MLSQLLNKSYLYKLNPKDNLFDKDGKVYYATTEAFLKYSYSFNYFHKPCLIRMSCSDLEVYENKSNSDKIVELTITSDKIVDTKLFGDNSLCVSIRKNEQNKYEYLFKYKLDVNESIIICPDLDLVNNCIPKDKRKFYHRTYLLKLKLNVLN